MTKPWRNITTIWLDKKNCVFVFISVNLTGDSTKGTSLQLFSEFDVEQANLRLNSYPRKILGGKSSLDRFEEEILKIIGPETLAV